MRRSVRLLCLSAACTVGLCAWVWGQGDAVARIGDRTLSVGQYEKLAAELQKTGYKHIKTLDREGKRALLDGIIARHLLVMEGVRRGYDRDPAIAEVIDKTRRRTVINALYEREAVAAEYSFTEEELRAFFAARQYDKEVLSQHIVCASEERARQALAALAAGAPFESLVASYSTEHIQRRFGPRGWVGWFKLGEVYDELKEPLGTMETGSLYPDPVKTAIGYHVFQLKARRPVAFEPNRAWVEKQALVYRRAKDMERYIDTLRRRYELRLDAAVFASLRQLEAGATAWPGPDKTLFSWRGGRLTAQDYMDEVGQGNARHPAVLDSAGLHKAADNLAGRQIMMAEAARLGLEKDANVLAAVDKERVKLLTMRLYQEEMPQRVPQISDAAVRAFYDENIAEFTREDGKVTEFSFLQESIRKALLERETTRAMDALLAELRQRFADQIEIFPEGLDLAFR